MSNIWIYSSNDSTAGIPQIVVSDFNVDLLSRKDDVITRTFSAFEQNIKSSTTCKLTCLDHIYTLHLNAQQAGVVPIYYSYHKMCVWLHHLFWRKGPHWNRPWLFVECQVSSLSRDDLAHHRNISLVDLVVCKHW
jgi:hypothetical protein